MSRVIPLVQPGRQRVERPARTGQARRGGMIEEIGALQQSGLRLAKDLEAEIDALERALERLDGQPGEVEALRGKIAAARASMTVARHLITAGKLPQTTGER